MTVETRQNDLLISRRKLIACIPGTLLLPNLGVPAWCNRVQILDNVLAADGEKTARPQLDKHPKPLEIRFTGPFSYGQRLLASAITTSWVELEHVAFAEQLFGTLNVYHQFKGVADSRRRIRIAVTATTVDGKVHTLTDGERVDPRLYKPTLVGSRIKRFSPHNSESLVLPGEPSEITELCVRLEDISRTSHDGGDQEGEARWTD